MSDDSALWYVRTLDGVRNPDGSWTYGEGVCHLPCAERARARDRNSCLLLDTPTTTLDPRHYYAPYEKCAQCGGWLFLAP